MQDPIGAFYEIRDKFILYIQTAFGTQFQTLERERERLLKETSIFYQEPWIEPLPRYQVEPLASAQGVDGESTKGKTIRDLTPKDVPDFDLEVLQQFQDLVACGLIGEYELYRHQIQMLKKSSAGQDCVVTAGTGSGKTESFLLPLFAYLTIESKNWPKPQPPSPRLNDWWSNANWQNQCASSGISPRIPQRAHETRDAAVRALILYPMNALVEDQLTRLRTALDSPTARQWFSDNRDGNRIYFGRYNGNTPIPGHERRVSSRTGDSSPDKDRIKRLIKELTEYDKSSRAAEKYAHENNNDEVTYFFPKLDGAEMRCRWDMQDDPPDILISNNSMLSIMLMRDADGSIFDKTRKWLEKDDSVFHLIIDELHLYRGTAGTEVAYLLRLLLARLGLSPNSPKLRILASSASLEPDDPDSLKFLSDFFGSTWQSEQIVPGYSKPIPDVSSALNLPHKSFIALAASVHDSDDTDTIEIIKELGNDGDASTIAPAHLSEVMESSDYQIGPRLLSACKKKGEVKAVSFQEFADNLFGSNLNEADRKVAAQGLLIARGLCDSSTGDNALPAFRLHWFFRNLEGLWACTMPDCQCKSDEQGEGRTAGKLFGKNRILCRDIGEAEQAHRVLELLYCEQCGTTFFGGNRFTLPDNEGWELLSTDPDIEGIPDRQVASFVERRDYGSYAIFWPSGESPFHNDAKKWKQIPIVDNNQAKEEQALSTQACWVSASLNTVSSKVNLGHQDQQVPNGPWVRGYIFYLPQLMTTEAQSNYSALPSICPCCATDYGRRMYRKSPVRGFRTGFSKVSQLLAKELFYLLPETGDSRKLVVFSDSREDAASISNGIERSHYSDLLREATYDEAANAVFGLGAVLEQLEDYGELNSQSAIDFARRNPNEVPVLKAQIELANMDIPPSLPEAARQSLEQSKTDAQRNLEQIRFGKEQRLIAVRRLFESDSEPVTQDSIGLLLSRLKRMGVNPAGLDILYQNYKLEDDNYHHWTKLFDFTSSDTNWATDPSLKEIEARNKMRAKVQTELSNLLFT